MGMATHAYPSKLALEGLPPSEAGAELHKWKKKLKAAFGSQGVGVGRQPVARAIGERVNPANIPLPHTPKKATGTFGSAERSPYFQDSHMVTPRSASRQTRLTKELDQDGSTENTRWGTGRRSVRRQTRDDSSSDDEYDDPHGFGRDGNDQTSELAQQIRDWYEMETENPTPRFEIAQHRPLGKIVPFKGKLDESENSMQWLRGFVYEMKGTHTPPNEWCVAFQLSLRDGAVYWRALSRKTKRDWKLLSSSRNRSHEKSRSEPRQTARVALAEATLTDLISEQQTCTSLEDANEYSDEYHNEYDDDNDEDNTRNSVDYYSQGEEPDEGSVSNYEEGHLAAANDNERREAANGTFARSDKRPQQYGQSQGGFNANGPRYNNGNSSKFFDNKGGLHDFGKCEAFDELAKLLRTNVDKKNISPELQKLVFGCPPTETGLVPTGQPQSAEPIIDAECIYAFVGKCEWPNEDKNYCMNMTGVLKERDASLKGNELCVEQDKKKFGTAGPEVLQK
ncbi:Eukaryotic/viral aspartic protease [Phytophthora megakarya]|uniref:Eukaryotic/viral aspartic protease n=1 Tax=Phytophthora megakarya TaxID=4795 RepID=A0A225UR87_9STRA|nr:Eukaryotic/viral aspartic protease [Phytophthora megakarya]